MGLLRRFANVFRPARLHREFDEELEFHRQMALRRARAEGLRDADAEQEIRRRIENTSVVKEEMRDARMLGWLASSLQDLRHGVALLHRDAGISALIVLLLALGIGGTTAIFTLFKAAFVDPLPYPDAGRLVTVMESRGWTPSVSEFLEIRDSSQILTQLAFAEHGDMQLSGAGEPVRIYAAKVTASFFPLLGVKPSLGRTLLPEENRQGSARVVVLTDAFWRSRMGADATIVGRKLRLDGEPATVIGVLPPQFHFDFPTLRIPEPVDVYTSYPIDPAGPLRSSGSGQGVAVRVIARLREGSSLAQAASELRVIAARLRDRMTGYATPDGKPPLDFSFQVLPLRDAIIGTQRSLLWLLLGGVAVLLLIACANTAQLLLARSLHRGREVAIRSALGASRVRLIRQFVLEGVILAICGGLAGLLAAGGIAPLVIAMLPVRSPMLAAVRWDYRVLAFTSLISLFSAAAFAVLPAVKSSTAGHGPNLNSRAASAEGNRWRHGIVALEGALSVFLLCGAGLIAQNLWTLVRAPMGFDPSHVIAMQIQLPGRQQNAPDHQAGQTLGEYLEKVAAIPGVDSAAVVTGPPLRPARGGAANLAGVADSSGSPITVISDSHQVSPDYFRTLRIPLLAGRTFRNSDAGGPPINVAIVNQEFARRFGLGADVVGKQIDDPDGPITIVGMVGNVRTRGLDAKPFSEVYISSFQFSWSNVYMMVRSGMPPAQLVGQVRSAIESSNPDQAIFGVTRMEDLLTDSISEPRFEVFLIGAFALLALLMAAAGMYSVIACLVTQRTGEIAIRIALGATRAAIVRTILGATVIWAALGLAAGLGLGLAARTTVRSLSGAIVAGSPWMYAGVAVFFFGVTLAAAYVPVRRTSQLDPAAALRAE